MLRRHRQQRGFSQGALAKLVYRDYTYISRLETGAILPVEPDEVLRLAVALRLTSTEADELLRAIPRFRSVRFRTDVAPFSPSDDQAEATWPNLLSRLVRVHALERGESAEAIAAHLAAFAGVPVVLAFMLDAANQPHQRRLKQLLVELAARDVRVAALLVLRNAVLLPGTLDSYQRRKQRLYLSLVAALVKIDPGQVDLAFRDAYSASLTQAQRDALRLFRTAVESKAPGKLTIVLPAL